MLLSMHAWCGMAMASRLLVVICLVPIQMHVAIYGPYMSMLVVCVFICLSVYLLLFL